MSYVSGATGQGRALGAPSGNGYGPDPHAVPRDEVGSYPALVGVVPITVGQRFLAFGADAVFGVAVMMVGYRWIVSQVDAATVDSAAVQGLIAGRLVLMLLVGFAYPLAALLVLLAAGGTIGQVLLGQRHLSVGTGRVAGGRAFGKYLLEGLVGGLTFGLAYLVALVTIREPLNRNFFDRLAGIIRVDYRAMSRAQDAHRDEQAGSGPGWSPGPQGAGARGANRIGAWEPSSPPTGGAHRDAADHQARSGLDWSRYEAQGAGLGDKPPAAHYGSPWDAPAHPDQASASPTGAAAVSPTSPSAPVPRAEARPATAPVGKAADAVDQTIISDVLRPSWQTDVPVAVVLDNGVRLVVDRLLVLGRSPTTRPGLEEAKLVPVIDDERSLSKSHLALGPAPGGIWIIDLDSTNGVRITSGPAAPRKLPRRQRVEVPTGSTVEYGMRTFEVVTG